MCVKKILVCLSLAAATLGIAVGCGNKAPSPQETASVHTDTVAANFAPDSGGGGIRDIEIEMVYVAGGTFTMGCTPEQGEDCWDGESPTHSVTLGDYYIGKYEVTQKQWREVMGTNPSYFTGSDNLPVETVGWDDIAGANGFIAKLNQQTGKKYRLPTEAEWEYAARGGKSSRHYKYSGSSTLGNVAWYWDNIPSQSSGSSGYGTQPVGGKAPNELGIYDMSGNVLEWVSDWYGSYTSTDQTNPTGPSSPGCYRVGRGGSWHSGAGYCRVSNRYGNYPVGVYFNLGIRLALSP